MIITESPLFATEINRINMNILTFGHAVLGTEWNYSNVCSPFTRVYFVQKGEGFLGVGDRKIKLLPGNIYIVPSGLTFDMRCEGTLEKLFVHIGFSQHNGQDIFSDCKKCIILRNRNADISNVAQYFENNNTQGAIATKEILYHIVFEAIKQENIQLSKSKNYSAQTQRTIDFIEDNLRSTLTVEKIAESIFVSASSLQKLFRKEVGVPIGRYVNDRIMLEAERMLHLNELSVKDISDYLGFCDQFYFSRCFSKCYGTSPTKYRKNMKI